MPSRKELIQQLERARGSRLICYFTGDRKNQEVQIGDDVLPCVSEHLSDIGKVSRLDLLLYTRGGSTLTSFALVNALREFTEDLQVLVPFRAHSGGTLIALGANKIVTGPFAQLSPIDPSITTPHSPTIEKGAQMQFLPVSVEDVANYFELARNEAGLKDEQHLASVLGHLCQRVSPLALGAVYRAREQIGMLAKKLLGFHIADEARIEPIVKQLTRELLSHDYIISRREARSFGLPVTDATEDEAKAMWQLYEDVARELQLAEPWNWEREAQGNQPKTSVRGVVESANLKHVFISTYQIKRVTAVEAGRKTESLQITPLDERWKKV